MKCQRWWDESEMVVGWAYPCMSGLSSQCGYRDSYVLRLTRYIHAYTYTRDGSGVVMVVVVMVVVAAVVAVAGSVAVAVVGGGGVSVPGAGVGAGVSPVAVGGRGGAPPTLHP